MGISVDLKELPGDLVQAADHRLVIPQPTAADVAELARLLCGDPPAQTFSEKGATTLTPKLLRLARRPGQCADAYICKLRDVLTRAAAVQAAQTAPSTRLGTPRDAPTLDLLHGMDEAVSWGMRLANSLTEFRAGRLPWADVDRGLLLSGPPGCGKTLFARALAATCNVELFSGSYGQWLGTGSGHQGDLLRNMRKLFADAKKAAPAIIFIDEVDSFTNRAALRHRYAEWDTQVVNALLALIDGVDDRAGVVLIAACNHPWKLDPALVRSGRLDRHIRIGLPSADALARILREHLHGDLANDDLARLALPALGSNGADCERTVRGARQRARLAGHPMVLADLAAEFDGGDERTPEELRIAAVHEAGHAVAAAVLRPGSVQAVTLRPRGDSGGSVMSRPPGPYQTVDQVRCFLTELLAGRAAEEVLLGIVCTGAGDGSDSDLARATGLAAAAIGSYGLLPDAGAVWLTGPDPDEAARTVRKHAGLAAHVRILLDQAHDAALHLVNEHRACVEAVADKLLHQRILTGEEIAATARTAAAQASDPSGARSPVVPAKPPSRDGNVGPSTARDAASSHDSPSPAHPSI